MPTIGILTFMSRIKFELSWVEPEKSFITSKPGYRTMGPDKETLSMKFFVHVLGML